MSATHSSCNVGETFGSTDVTFGFLAGRIQGAAGPRDATKLYLAKCASMISHAFSASANVLKGDPPTLTAGGHLNVKAIFLDFRK